MKATGNFAALQGVDPTQVLSDQTRACIDRWVAKFPPNRKRSAVLQSLMAAQRQNEGWLSEALMVAVARYLDIPAIWAYEVATFYSMFQTEKVGRHHVAFCTNISCWLNGADNLVAHAQERLGCRLGESTADGRIYLKCEQECFAGCTGAPMMMVNGHYHERLTKAKVDAILDELE